MKILHVAAFILVIVGALNWGVLAVSGWEIGQLFGGMEEPVSKVIYILIGLAALVELATHKKYCKNCCA